MIRPATEHDVYDGTMSTIHAFPSFRESFDEFKHVPCNSSKRLNGTVKRYSYQLLGFHQILSNVLQSSFTYLASLSLMVEEG